MYYAGFAGEESDRDVSYGNRQERDEARQAGEDRLWRGAVHYNGAQSLTLP